MKLDSLGALVVLGVMSSGWVGALPQVKGDTERVSVRTSGVEGLEASRLPSLSGNGRFVAFESDAPNLIPGDGNSASDIFVHDRFQGTTVRVSVDSGGRESNGDSFHPAISGGGRYVVFSSVATDLVLGDTNGVEDVFMHDLETGTTTRVSVNAQGVQGNGVSRDPDLSDDGSRVAFSTRAKNLVAGHFGNHEDVVVRDLITGEYFLGSASVTGLSGNGASRRPSLSGDGTHVGFDSKAKDLIDDDTNFFLDVFVRDLEAGTTFRASESSWGTESNGDSFAASLSFTGRYVAFQSKGNSIDFADVGVYDDIFRHDAGTSETWLVSINSIGESGNLFSMAPSISSDGRFVAYHSWASDLIVGDHNGDFDAYVWDDLLRVTERVSVDSAGGQGQGHSTEVSISADGRYVGFQSAVTTFAPGDTNGVDDIFVHDFRGSFLLGLSYCFGDGTGVICPCGNTGAPGEGCANSVGDSGFLTAWGSTSVASDDLTLSAHNLFPGAPALLFVGTGAAGSTGQGVTFGAGLRCVGGGINRYMPMPPDATGTVTWDPGLQPQGQWAPGDYRFFQVWYRDAGGPYCGSVFNLTQGVRILFTP